jgi:hypothetical protein
MDRMPSKSELTSPEFLSLREIVSASFMSRGSLPNARRARLIELGLIKNALGGVVATPAGRIVARQ